MKAHIITVHHKYTDSINIFRKYFHPMQVGADLSKVILEIEKDNQGENISKKNQNYCELTAHYNVWRKNIVADYVGLMHYRRIFNPKIYIYQRLKDYSVYLAKKLRSATGYSDLNLHYLPMETIKSRHILEKVSSSLLDHVKENDKVDVFLPRKIKFAYVNVQNQYALRHCKHQFDLFNSIAMEAYPELKRSIELIGGQKKLHAFNMFIMKKSLFDEYSEMLFNVLQSFENRISLLGMNQHQSRIFGFLSERFFNYYILYKSTECNINIRYLNVSFVEEELI